MKKLALIVAIFLAGCASTWQSGRNRETQAELTEKIAQLERQCEEKTIRDTNSEIARITAGGDTLAELEIAHAKTEGDRQIAACRAEADRADEKITRSEISEYENQAQEQQQRNSMMATLTATRIH
jgi:hypothetical protein